MLLFNVCLADILPLVKCKPEAETIILLKIHLIKLGHLQDAVAGYKQHRQTLYRILNVVEAAADERHHKSSRGGDQQTTSRAATLHSIVNSTISETKDSDICLLNNITKELEELFHIEVFIHFMMSDTTTVHFLYHFRDHFINMQCKINRYHKK